MRLDTAEVRTLDGLVELLAATAKALTTVVGALNGHTEKPEPDEQVSPPPAEQKKRAKARRFVQLTQDGVERLLDLCAMGHDNLFIAEELYVSPDRVSRIRARGKAVEHMWPWIDAWTKKHPQARVYAMKQMARRKR